MWRFWTNLVRKLTLEMQSTNLDLGGEAREKEVHLVDPCLGRRHSIQ